MPSVNVVVASTLTAFYNAPSDFSHHVYLLPLASSRRFMDEPSVSGTQVQGLNQLLTTKLHIPSLNHSLVPRPRLLERLNQGMERKHTLLTAPAGFGKTHRQCQCLNASVYTAMADAGCRVDQDGYR